MSASKKPSKKASSKSQAAKKGASAKKAATKKAATKKSTAGAATKKAVSTKAGKKSTSRTAMAKKSKASSTQKNTTRAAKGATPAAATKKVDRKSTKKAPATRADTEKRPVKSLTATPTNQTDRTIPSRYKYLHDKTWLKKQREALLRERANYTSSADRLEAEAAALMADREPGDVQFDEESGEGDTIAVERDSSLARSAQNRQAVAEIDAALERLDNKTYGLCMAGDDIIPRERLEAIPEAAVCVMHKTLMF